MGYSVIILHLYVSAISMHSRSSKIDTPRIDTFCENSRNFQNSKMSIFGPKNVGKIQSKIDTPKIDTLKIDIFFKF